MCSAFIPDCGYDNSTIFLIGDVYCPNTKCLRKLFLHKKTFQSPGRSEYQCLQCASVCQVHNIPSEDQTYSFFLSFGPRVYIFEENPKSIQDVIGDVYCPGEYCLNKEKCKSFGSYVATPTNNCSIKFHLNQPIIERKNCVWTTSKLLEMCIVPHRETKSVFTFQPIKRLVSTTVKSAKPAATF